MLLDLSLLEDVGLFSSFSFFSKPPYHSLILRAQSVYIASVLIVFMLATVCPSHCQFAMRSNGNCAVWEFFGNSDKSCIVRGVFPATQAGVVCYVRIVQLLLASSDWVSYVKYVVRHECGFEYCNFSCTPLAIPSNQVTFQSYPKVINGIVEN
jgi:hypothetical protein